LRTPAQRSARRQGQGLVREGSKKKTGGRRSDGGGGGGGAQSTRAGQQQWQQQQRWQQRRPQQQQQWRGNPHNIFRQVWGDLGMADIDSYIDRVKYELGHAIVAVGRGDSSPAWAFARSHRGLLIGTIVPALVLFRVPAAAAWSTRLLVPLLAAARFLPLEVQWYLLSRLWVKAILYTEKLLSIGTNDSEQQKRR